MTYATEFPDFAAAELPPVPKHWEDSSWHNDACPSFHISDSLRVFIDYADGSKSEFPEERARGDLKRFSLQRLEDGQVPVEPERDPPPYQTDDFDELLAAAIAEEFAANLRDWLSGEEWAEMRARNARPEYRDTQCCASHDFCDANMAMSSAFETVMGREAITIGATDAEVEADCTLWNRAWEIATERHLRAPAD